MLFLRCEIWIGRFFIFGWFAISESRLKTRKIEIGRNRDPDSIPGIGFSDFLQEAEEVPGIEHGLDKRPYTQPYRGGV